MWAELHEVNGNLAGLANSQLFVRPPYPENLSFGFVAIAPNLRDPKVQDPHKTDLEVEQCAFLLTSTYSCAQRGVNFAPCGNTFLG
jgi:hypothetical protein